MSHDAMLPAPGEPGRAASALYPPRLDAVRRARRFVEGELDTAGLTHCVHDAGLLVTELAANAVLHARTPFGVHLRAVGSGARVQVHDRSSVLPVFTAPSATAMSGRGLGLVASVAARWGSEATPTGKSVWFEVEDVPAAEPEDLSVEELLALWSDEPADDAPAPSSAAGHEAVQPAAAQDPVGGLPREVVVPDLPVAALLAAKEHMDDLLRELQLVLLAPRAPGSAASFDGPGDVEVARRLDAAARAFESGRLQVREQVSRAAARGEELVTVRLQLVDASLEDALEYRRAVDDAERLSRSGSLLTLGLALGHDRCVRSRYLDEVVRQLGGR